MKSLLFNRIRIITVTAWGTFFLCLASADTTHVVQKGETLYSLSRQYKTTVAALCKANNIADGVSVKAGQKLLIPDGQAPAASADGKTSGRVADKTHLVQKGETWYGISRTYGIAVADLQAANKASADSVLKIGQKLVIPMGASIVSAVASAAQEKKSGRESSMEQKATASTKVDVPDLKTADPRSYSAKKGDSSLVWPVKSPAVTYVNGKVSGVNLSAQKNESVSAIREGTVMFSGLYRGFGNVVFVQSKTGHIYAYTGLGSVRVNKGEYISYGQTLGTAGVDAISERPQVSLMVFQNGLPIDPAKAPRG